METLSLLGFFLGRESW